IASKDNKNQSNLFIIFDATEDLFYRKLAPALYNLFLSNSKPKHFTIIGTARGKLTDEVFRKRMLDGVNQFSRNGKADKKVWDDFSKHIIYQVADVEEDQDYKELAVKIQGYENEWEENVNSVFYLAVSPHFFPVIAKRIADNKLATNPETSRIIIEKPFGHDLVSAKSLNALL